MFNLSARCVNRRAIMSTFHGLIQEIKHIAIDWFKDHSLQCTTFFLSHCHNDHMEGIRTREFIHLLETNPKTCLYCSEVTRHILISDDPENCVKNKICVLSVREPNILRIPSPLDEGFEEVTVTLIPAGHCPGSVMFLFEGEKKTILYTGDFRVLEGDVEKLSQLHTGLERQPKVIDTVYMDTTFCSQFYCWFPPRSDSVLALSQAITEWLDMGPDHIVLLETSARYGSEFLYIELSRKLNMKIHVHKNKYDTYKLIPEILSAITIDPKSTRIHSCQQAKKRYSSRFPIYYLNCLRNPCQLRVIKPAALWYRSRSHDQPPICEYSMDGKKVKVSYSCHCSYSELKYFTNYLKPKKVVPCVVSDLQREEDLSSLMSLIRPLPSNSPNEAKLPVTSRVEEIVPCTSLNVDNILPDSLLDSPPLKRKV